MDFPWNLNWHDYYRNKGALKSTFCKFLLPVSWSLWTLSLNKNNLLSSHGKITCLSRTSWKSPLCTHLNKTQSSFTYLKTKVITQVHGFCVSLINHGLLCLFHFKHAIKIQVLINSFHSTDNSFTESETCILQKVISFVVNQVWTHVVIKIMVTCT